MSKDAESRDHLSAIEHAPLEKASARKEAIAIIGMGCRFPGGANNPEAFWQLLREGQDAIREIPADRFSVEEFYDPDPDTPGKMSIRHGGFIDQIQDFDAHFFHISPREVVSLDPQQRLLLEVSWEALENAGLAPERLTGSQTGVFIGICSSDYSQLLLAREHAEVDAYLGSGMAHSVASGRLSYLLGLQGPSLSVDTACSSSLVAVHLACQSLLCRECDLALVGGANLLLSPEIYIIFSKARMLAADGRCKTFDAAADGYVRAEGCGVVVLKRLSDAVAEGDNILAVIRGSAINQDGRTSGLTVPNGPAQQAVMRKALENAGIEPTLVHYVEAHGTGTSLGDPIEVQALGAVFGKNRLRDNPLVIGSVKTNLGHLEAVAGIAGLIKAVLSLQNEEIPPHLHFKRPNPHIRWSALPVVVPTERMPWPAGQRRRIAGVSSFGFSGTNVHVVLEEAPAPAPVQVQAERPLHLLALSARTEVALAQLAGRYADHLAANPTMAMGDVCFSANTGRSHFHHRLSVVAESLAQAWESLAACANGQERAGVIKGQVTGQTEVAFLFTGQGSQYAGMGRQLYETQPTFRRCLERCADIVRPWLEWPLLDVLYPATGTPSRLHETAYTQPALFALEYALAELWQSWGVSPAVVMGHSVGEYVAACVAGVFSLEDGLKLLAERGRLMQALPQDGAMVAVFADEARVAAACQPYAQEVAIAALNGPQQIVISGRRQAVQQVVAGLAASGVRTQPLPVSHAFHSPLMEPILAAFARTAREVTYRVPHIGVISNLTGQLATEDLATPAYWVRHVRQPVRFAAGIGALHHELGAYSQAPVQAVCVEIGPHPTLVELGRLCLPAGGEAEQGPPVEWLHSLRQGQSDWQQLLQSVGTLYVRGVPIDWGGLDRDYARRRVALPTYPFQRERFWVKPAPARPGAPQASQGSRSPSLHPLLGRRLYLAGAPESRFEVAIGQDCPALLGHQRIHDRAILPATAYVEMALAAGAAVFTSEHVVLERVVFQQALIVPEAHAKTVQVVLTPAGAVAASFQIFSCTPPAAQEEPAWTLHAFGQVGVHEPPQAPAPADLAALQAQCTEDLSGAAYYQRFRERGIAVGSFCPLVHVWWRAGEALGQIQLPEDVGGEASAYRLHPAILNAGLQVLGAACPAVEEDETYLPVGVERVAVFGRPGRHLWSQVSLRPGDGQHAETLTGEVRLLDPTGQVVAAIEGLGLKRTRHATLVRATQERVNDWLYQVQWQPQAHPHHEHVQVPSHYLPAPHSLVARVQPGVPQLNSQYGLDLLDQEFMPQFDSLCTAYVLQAFHELGWEACLAQPLSVDSLAEQLGIVDHYRRLLRRMLEMLEEDGVLLQKVGATWEVARVPAFEDPTQRLATLLAQFPAYKAGLSLLGACGQRFAEVWRGTCDPLQLLFPGGSFITVEQLYQDWPESRMYNTLVQRVISTALERVPAGRTVRLLEVGAGTGGTTASVLPGLPAAQMEYVFTDLSQLFLAKAAQKFSTYPFVRYQLLDIEHDPRDQEFPAHQFDVVLAANVLHATRDLRQTLRYVQQLLAPEGLIVLLEGSGPQRWVDLTFGLTEGWWKFTDVDVRPSHPLLSRHRWLDLLRELDFTECLALSDEKDSARGAVIVARGPQVTQVANRGTASAAHTGPQGPWLIFADRSGVGQQLAALLQERGERCLLVFSGEAYVAGEAGQCRINPTRPDDFQRLVHEVLDAEQRPCRGVVHLWSLEAAGADETTLTTLEDAQVLGCGSVLYLVQTLASTGGLDRPAFWCVTRTAQSVGTEVVPLAVAQTPLWGLGRVVALEHPELWGGLVDLDVQNTTRENAMQVLVEISLPDDEDQVAWRNGQRHVARLVPAGAFTPQPAHLHADSTYLITGGLGGLGLKVARWLTEHGARHLVLTGRRGLPERAKWATLSEESEMFHQVAAIEAIETLGATVTIAAADVSDMACMAAVLTQIAQSSHPLRGIVHAAVAPSAWTLTKMSREALFAMLQPKVIGTWVLHQLTQSIELDFFVCFSSTTALLGASELAHYAAANTFLDGLAHYRQARGLPGLSINWGLWDVIRGASAEEKARIVQCGLQEMPSKRALAIFGDLLGSTNLRQITVAAVDWHVLKPTYEAKRKRPFLARVETRPRAQETRSAVQPSDLIHQVAQARPEERRELVMGHVQAEVARVLGIEPSRPIDVQQGLFELGMDSLMSLEMKSRLEASVGQALPATLLFNYPTIRALAEYLTTQVLTVEAVVTSAAELQVVPQSVPKVPTPVLSEGDELSEDQLVALLAKKLAQLG